jgi:hypothetical protein
MNSWMSLWGEGLNEPILANSCWSPERSQPSAIRPVAVGIGYGIVCLLLALIALWFFGINVHMGNDRRGKQDKPGTE